MKLRVIEYRKEKLILCPNGSIMKADKEALAKLLTSFQRLKGFKGEDGYWNAENADIEDVYGTTLAFVDEMNRMVILSDKLFEIEKKITYISATEYADLHGKSRPMVKKLCADGRIEGAYKTSSGWLIPEDAPYPERKGKVKNETRR